MPIDRRCLVLAAFLLATLLPACQGAQKQAALPPAVMAVVPVEVARTRLASESACAGRFVPHPLGVTSGARMRDIRTYASNGSGLASGDLDIVANNLRSQAQLFENQLCKGVGLEVELAWPASPDTHAIGAQLDLHTSLGVLRRDIRSASGYLSGDPPRVHFGFPSGTELKQLLIRFPDGVGAQIDSPEAQTLLKVMR